MIHIRVPATLPLLLAGALCATGCKDDPTDPGPEHAEEIAAVVAGVPGFLEATEWAEREDSVTAVDTVTESVTEGNEVTTTVWLEETVHYSASENPDEYMMFNPLASVLWPGNLVQGNSIAGGVPNSVPIEDRAPGNIVLAIVSGDSSGTVNEFSRTIEHFRASDVIQAMNEILAGYEGGTPARYSYSFEQVHSASQLNFDLRFGYSGPLASVEGRFAFNKENAKSRIAVRLTQQFYTMVYDDPQGPAGVFGPSVTAATLDPYTGDGNPICYISSVTYGRVYILLYESEASMQELEAALQFAYAGASGSTEASFNEVMSKTSVSILQIGGDPAAGLETGAGQSAPNLEKISEFMTRGANFSASNPGEPISYTVKYLRDATLVRMNNTMEYTVVQRTPISSDTSFTSSTFNMLFKNVVIQLGEDAADPGIRVRVFTVDEGTAQADTLWRSPTNHYDEGTEGEFWGLSFDTPNLTTLELPASWTVPEFELPDDPSLSLYIEFWAAEFDPVPAGWRGERTKLRFIYDAGIRQWRTADGLAASKMTVTPPDMTIEFNFEVERNGSVIQ